MEVRGSPPQSHKEDFEFGKVRVGKKEKEGFVAESCLHSNKASSLEIRFLLTLPVIGLRGNRCLYCFFVCAYVFALKMITTKEITSIYTCRKVYDCLVVEW